MELSDITKDKMIQELALMYAANTVMYGVDVTKEWETATQNAMVLNQAYIRGREDERKKIEGLKEQGLLIELPVAEATTVYMISNNTECCAICKYFCEGYYDCEDECLKLDNRPSFPQYADKPICDKQFLEVIEYTPNLDWIFNNRKLFGKTVFLTRVEAKAKLKKLQSK